MVAALKLEPAPNADTARAQLFAAIAHAQGQARAVGKDARNKFHSYNYASAEAIIAEAKEAMAEAGLGVVRVAMSIERLDKPLGERAADGGKKAMEGAVALLHARWAVCHGGGGSIEMEVEWPIVPESGRPIDKALAAAHTASLAYLLRDLLQLPRVEDGTGLDDDRRDRARHEEESAKPKQSAREAVRAAVNEAHVDIVAKETAAKAERDRKAWAWTLAYLAKLDGAKSSDELLTVMDASDLETRCPKCSAARGVHCEGSNGDGKHTERTWKPAMRAIDDDLVRGITAYEARTFNAFAGADPATFKLDDEDMKALAKLEERRKAASTTT